MRSHNPAFSYSKNSYSKNYRAPHVASGQQMTINGTVNRTLLLTVILVAVAGYVWHHLQIPIGAEGAVSPLMMMAIAVGGIGGFIVAIITFIKAEWSPVLAPIYAALEGLAIGALSSYAEMKFPGIVWQAVMLTFGTLFGMLIAYRLGLVRATEKFKLGVMAATGGIFLVYLAGFILSFFGIGIPYLHESGPIGIGFSLFVIVIAALNLVLDFAMIEESARDNSPQYMEWYCSFGLMVTIIWLYIEFLVLLMKLKDGD